jgi:two-component system sensor histidine kinase KdpD
MESEVRPQAQALLHELGLAARLTVYLASAPGAGKTRRLIEEARTLQHAGIDVVIGWVDIKGRPDLQRLVDGLKFIPPRKVEVTGKVFEDFDLEATLSARPSTVILDELAHTNLDGGKNAKRWQDALALREAGISVIGSLNVQHLENVAPVAERAIGFPIREIVPLSFLQAADQVIAIDAPPDLIEARLRSGAIVPQDDIERALAGSFKPQTLAILRELMLRTLDDLATPILRPMKVSTVLAILDGKGDPSIFLRKCAGFADATDLALEVTSLADHEGEVERLARNVNARMVPALPSERGLPNWSKAAATVVAVPNGDLARSLAAQPSDRHIFVVDPTRLHIDESAMRTRHPYAQTAGDRLRIGYGKFTVYLGAAAGCGKTYAMLDRAHQMRAQGVDVVAALVETHGRADTAKMLEGLELLPRKNDELDREALLARKPEVALIDELAHTNEAGSEYPKRYQEVLSIIRSGISVITTLNVQHLEGLSDAVLRLTGQRIRETLPDGILELADDVILIDATPETLRDRLRAGKIYPAAHVDAALSNFFSYENLTALRELAIREVVHARAATRLPPPFSHMVLGVKGRERDVQLIEWCGRLTSRLDVELSVLHVAPPGDTQKDPVYEQLRNATHKARASWHVEYSERPAEALNAFARQRSAALAVEGPRSKARFWDRRKPFARMVLDAGATELFIFSPALFQTT